MSKRDYPVKQDDPPAPLPPPVPPADPDAEPLPPEHDPIHAPKPDGDTSTIHGPLKG